MERRKTRKILSITIGALIVIGLSLLVIFESRNLRTGPTININTPESGLITGSSSVQIIGLAKNISFITMNGGQIFTDELGNFKENYQLSYGYNLITLKAEDRFKRSVEKTIEIIYK